jgi:hypothetical protein
MTLEAATALAFDFTHDDFAPAQRAILPANDPADPEAGWASRNPERAMLFLFVTPRDCAAVDELMAA